MTAIRNLFFGVVIIVVLAVVFSHKANEPGSGPATGNGDDGVRVTFSVRVTNFKPGMTKPLVHYVLSQTQGQMQQESDSEGIPVGDNGRYEKSLGMLKRGTFVTAWAVEPARNIEHPYIEITLYFDGKSVQFDTNQGEGADGVAMVERVVA